MLLKVKSSWGGKRNIMEISLNIMAVVFLSLGLLIGLLLLIIWIISSRLEKKRKGIVKNTSTLLKNLQKLNVEFKFYWDIEEKYVFKRNLNSKSQFDRYDLEELFDEVVLNYTEMVPIYKKLIENRNLYALYSNQVSLLSSTVTQEEAKKWHIPYDKYKIMEKEMFNRQILKPILDSQIICVATYTSPQGRNRYSKKAVCSIDIVPARYELLMQKIAEQNSEVMRRKRERSLMTNKLRYSILKRDGFKCQLCGRTANDDVKLHIDHILPVSKGGKTEPSNLRVLCDACNLGKSDDLE